jgi:hypothetical protein
MTHCNSAILTLLRCSNAELSADDNGGVGMIRLCDWDKLQLQKELADRPIVLGASRLRGGRFSTGTSYQMPLLSSSISPAQEAP